MEICLSFLLPDDVIIETVDILVKEWGGNKLERYNRLKNKPPDIDSERTHSAPKASSYRSYILVSKQYGNNNQLSSIGHVEIKNILQCGFDCGAAPNVVILSFIIKDEYRRKGIGKVLMTLTENMCRDLGYCYIYLWTSDAVSFYFPRSVSQFFRCFNGS